MANRNYKIYREEYINDELTPVTNYFEDKIDAINYINVTVGELVAEANKAWDNGDYGKFHDLKDKALWVSCWEIEKC